ncbi:urease accessory protein UreH domain-containing protein [Haloplanus rubicundus]|uniref:High-affinity nickel-transporter protein n=1 Tax=Haloplanus rubicundus TaxID=1547898 RepID=A0A345EA67_9EURY|nr:sulfite exporter TauE/SafE family protein [Haloplanus rubicundus]AXG09089.1 high-affinity nickel-transporter protein [Haloplanus rubicundus]
MSLVAAAVAGGALGARHALETDHLAAIVTLVDDDPSRPGLVGASWGVGHTLPIAALGVTFLLLGVRLPTSVTALFEGVVGVVLVYLGARMLAGVLGYREHDHGTHPLHGHLQVGDLSLGGGHVHLHGDSVLVGALHGVAGSGALVVALVAAAPDLPTGVAFLAAFGVGSVLTMAAASAVWGRSLDAGARRTLRGLAGVVGVAVGCLLLAEVAGLV